MSKGQEVVMAFKNRNMCIARGEKYGQGRLTIDETRKVSIVLYRFLFFYISNKVLFPPKWNAYEHAVIDEAGMVIKRADFSQTKEPEKCSIFSCFDRNNILLITIVNSEIMSPVRPKSKISFNFLLYFYQLLI